MFYGLAMWPVDVFSNARTEGQIRQADRQKCSQSYTDRPTRRKTDRQTDRLGKCALQ